LLKLCFLEEKLEQAKVTPWIVKTTKHSDAPHNFISAARIFYQTFLSGQQKIVNFPAISSL
jgi:hypothetical protein